MDRLEGAAVIPVQVFGADRGNETILDNQIIADTRVFVEKLHDIENVGAVVAGVVDNQKRPGQRLHELLAERRLDTSGIAIAKHDSRVTQFYGPPSDERAPPPSKRAMIGLPATSNRPGRGGVACVSAGMVSRNGRVQDVQPNPIADQGFTPCPPNLMNFPG